MLAALTGMADAAASGTVPHATAALMTLLLPAGTAGAGASGMAAGHAAAPQRTSSLPFLATLPADSSVASSPGGASAIASGPAGALSADDSSCAALLGEGAAPLASPPCACDCVISARLRGVVTISGLRGAEADAESSTEQSSAGDGAKEGAAASSVPPSACAGDSCSSRGELAALPMTGRAGAARRRSLNGPGAAPAAAASGSKARARAHATS